MNSVANLKAGIYFSHYECFGHTSRVIAIAQVFKKKLPQGSFFFIQGGRCQPKAYFRSLGLVYELPYPSVDRGVFRAGLPAANPHADTRSSLCSEIIKKEDPGIFITEFFPMGREESRHELIPALLKASARGVSLWAAAGYPLLWGDGKGWRDRIVAMYQKIIIFSPSAEKDRMAAAIRDGKERKRYEDFFKVNENKIVFAGYLLPQGQIIDHREDVNIPKPPIPPKALRVTVVRGGGAVYPKIIAEAIRASDILGDAFYWTVVAGPSTTAQEWYLFSSLVAKKKIKNVALLKAAADYEDLIQDSDVCVTTASYHSAVMLMKHRKRAVIIPFSGYENGTEFSEQPARAAMLKDLMGACVIPINDLTSTHLAATVKEALSQPGFKGEIPAEWFAGDVSLGNIFSAHSLR